MAGSLRKNVLVIGGGAVGAIAALNLEVGGLASVTLVLRSNYHAVDTDGYTINSCDHGHIKGWKPSSVRNTVPNIIEEHLPPYDYIVLTTKNIPDISPTVVDLVAPALSLDNKHTVLVLIQNGLHIHKPFAISYPSTIVLSGISMIGSEEVSLGCIEQGDHDRLIIGQFLCTSSSLNESAEAAAREFVRMYASGGKTNCSYGPSVLHDRWRKLVYNACLNPICAITGLDTGRIRLAGGGATVEMLVRPAMQEIVKAAKTCDNVDLGESIVQQMIDVDPLDAYLSPSMLADVRKGNFIEVENLLGEPLREGKKAGVNMPTVELLYHLAKAIQWRTLETRGRVKTPVKREL